MENISRFPFIIAEAVLRTIGRLYCVDDGEAESISKFIVPLVAARDCHYGTSPIIHKHIISRKNRQKRPGYRVLGIQPCKEAGFSPVIFYPVAGCFRLSSLPVFADGRFRVAVSGRPPGRDISFPLLRDFFKERMLGGNNGKS